MARPRFDPNANFTAARSFTYHGVPYAAGAPFNKDGIPLYKLGTLYTSRAINQDAGETASVDPVQLTQTKPGYFEITAPWLDEPEKVRGKANAETRLAELREAGEPLDHHGVAISGGEGGWYTITRDGVDGELKVQGEEAARASASLLRSGELIEGQPIEWDPSHYGLILVEPADPENADGEYRVLTPWLEGIETLATKDEAEARAAVIRKAGPPDDFDLEAKPLYEVAAEKAAEEARTAAFVEQVSIASSTEGEGDAAKTTFSVAAPGLEAPEAFETEDAAKARQTELREAGPPEGWMPAEE